MKKVLPLIVVLLCILSLSSGCKKQTKVHRERAIRVTVQTLEKRVFREQLPLQGTVMPLEYATISAKISGTLENLPVSSGDRLKAGDVLFEIDRQVLKNQLVVKEDEILVKKAALESALHTLESAKIKFEQAKRDYDRAVALAESNATSRSNLESAETAYRTAEMTVKDASASVTYAQAQLKQAESNLEIARTNLADSIVRAPFDCVVFDTYVEANEYVTTGKNILRLENPDKLEVVCYLSAVYYHKVVPGESTVEFVDGSGKVLGSCKVSYKSPGVDPASRTFEIKALVPEDVKLVSGMLCEFNLVLQEKASVGLPADAMMLRANNRYIVYTVNDEGRAESVTVQRGITDGSYCEVLNAEDFAGKNVIITGQTFVNNNTLLDIINRDNN